MPTVDSKGRVVLPAEVRESLGIHPGTEVEIYEADGKAVVEPVDDPDRVIDRMDELVAEIEDRDPIPYDELDSQSKAQVDTIRRQADQSDAGTNDE